MKNIDRCLRLQFGRTHTQNLNSKKNNNFNPETNFCIYTVLIFNNHTPDDHYYNL